MPVVLDTPDTPPPERPNRVEVARPAFKGVTVDSKFVPTSSLLTHVEGMSWTINYYSQVLDRDNALSAQSKDRDAVYQQYKLIQKLELRVTTALTQSQDVNTKEFKLVGQANVYPCGLIPNEGDHFIADMGDGREGVFMVISSEARSIYKDVCYIIDYELLDYSNTRINDLNSKVVENLYYEKDFLTHGQNPFIGLNDLNLTKQLRQRYEEMEIFYFDRFFSNEYRTLLIPGQDYAIYDPFHTKAVLNMFRDSEHEKFNLVRDLNVSGDDAYHAMSVWDVFILKRAMLLKGAVKHVGLVSARCFTKNPLLNSIYHSGVDFVVYPLDAMPSWDVKRSDRSFPIADTTIQTTPSLLTDLVDLLPNTELFGLPQTDAKLLNNITTDSYVFSEDFYTRTNPNQSILELLVWNYLEEKAYNLTQLLALANTYPGWAPLNQFYQLPFLLAIMRSAIRRI